MKRPLALLFGILCYGIFIVAFLYQIGFLEGLVVPRAIDDGPVGPVGEAVAVNVVLLGLFAVQHTIMARIGFKRWWTGIVPEAIERSVFVLLSSLILLLVNWRWRAMPETVWRVDADAVRMLLHGTAAAGWGIVLYSTFLVNHFDLFGLRQVWFHFRGREYVPVEFRESLFYRWVRHPLMVGFLIAFWATPDMSQGRLLFAAVMTAYVILGIHVEERTLIALHGDDYRRYRERVSMIIPRPPRGRA